MVIWPPPGMEAFCTFVEGVTEEVTELFEDPEDTEGNDPESGDDGVSSIDESYSAPDLPEATQSAGDQFTESLGAIPGNDGPIENIINKAVNKIVRQNGIDHNTGFAIPPPPVTPPPEGLTMGATASKPKGDLGAKELSAAQSAFVQFTKSITAHGAIKCWVKLAGANTFRLQVGDSTYDGNVAFNVSVGAHIDVADNTTIVFEAIRSGGVDYGATGGGYKHDTIDQTSTVSLFFNVNF
mgnify:FL=1